MIPRALFTPEHETFRDSVRRFLEAEVKPHDERWQEQGYADKAVWKKAGGHGYLCMSMPEEYGGSGADKLFSMVLIEEQARINNSSLGWGLHSEIVAPYLLNYGSEALKKKYLPKMAAGEMIGAIAMSEPGAGSDLQSVKTTAIQKKNASGDNVYVVNGSKTFITNGWNCDLVIVVAKTDPAKGAKGTSLVVVDTSMKGFAKGKRLKKMGLKGQDTAELFFDNVEVPAENLLGQENNGFIYLMQELPWERMQIAIGAAAKCGSRAALDHRLRERTQGLRQAGGQFPEHALQAGGGRYRGADHARVRRPLHGTAAGEEARHRHRLDGQVLGLRHGRQGAGRMPAAARRLRLHVGIPDLAGLRRRARAAHLRGHQ